MKKLFKSNRKVKYESDQPQEDQLFINQKKTVSTKKRKNNRKIHKIFSPLIIILMITIILLFLFGLKKMVNIFESKINNKTFIYKNDIKNSNISVLKYQHLLPRLSPDSNDIPSSLEAIFNARQIYISDAKITPDYIRYIRPINETEEEKYKKPYSENKTIIDKNLFAKRDDQYNYVEFCKLALNEQLIDNKNIEYDNNPIISIIIPSYNKEDILLKSIRSIQNQNFKNIEIIIVNDCSTDNSSNIFNYLLKTDPRVRIFHNIKNLGLFRTRLNGILYSRGKYIISFDSGDLYEDNYVLFDAYNIMEKYNLDSCKFLFRIIRSFNKLNKSHIFFHVGNNDKIVYETANIKALNNKVFSNWGNIWNRLVRANIFIKGLLLYNELVLNLYKNVWEDFWYNSIVNKASFSYTIFERVGYVYLQDGSGVGSPRARTIKQKSNVVMEYVGFLYFHYNFYGKNQTTKAYIIKKLKDYNETHPDLRLQNFRSHFEVLNNLLEALIKDPDLIEEDRIFCRKLLNESINREIEVNKSKYGNL